jgi:hypothetical protein
VGDIQADIPGKATRTNEPLEKGLVTAKNPRKLNNKSISQKNPI